MQHKTYGGPLAELRALIAIALMHLALTIHPQAVIDLSLQLGRGQKD